MIIEIDALLDPDRVHRFREALKTAQWAEGGLTAGYQSALVKHNRQLPGGSEVGLRLGAEIIEALRANLLFQSAALPAAIFPPLFSRFEPGDDFGTHVDNAFRPLPDGSGSMRTDLSATLFLSDPDSYQGGELIVEEGFREQRIKLSAGSMILYPSTTLHRVAPVTEGARLAAVFWVRSLVADAHRRAILFDMDLAIQSLRGKVGDTDGALIALTGCYHNLLRLWGAA